MLRGTVLHERSHFTYTLQKPVAKDFKGQSQLRYTPCNNILSCVPLRPLASCKQSIEFYLSSVLSYSSNFSLLAMGLYLIMRIAMCLFNFSSFQASSELVRKEWMDTMTTAILTGLDQRPQTIARGGSRTTSQVSGRDGVVRQVM